MMNLSAVMFLSCSNDELVRCYVSLLPFLVDSFQGVLIYELCVFIQVGNFLLPKRNLVAPVKTSNVILDLLNHLPPVVVHVVFVHFPAKTFSIQSSTLHQMAELNTYTTRSAA